MHKFCALSSGSSGNSIYIGTDYTNILIDAGMSGKYIIEGLKSIGVDAQRLDAIFITHEHSDHAKGAGILSRKLDVPIYATEGTWEGMCHAIGKVREHNIRYVYDEEVICVNDLCVKPFAIPHDAIEPVAYNIFSDKCKFTIATDLGHITEEIMLNLKNSDIMLVEANHDVDMLLQGPYPYHLKQRILSNFGHLSNEHCGEMLTEVLSDTVKHVFLGHLSGENNHESVAMDTVLKYVKGKFPCNVDIAHRGRVSKMVAI